jgi:hypothetical protein
MSGLESAGGVRFEAPKMGSPKGWSGSGAAEGPGYSNFDDDRGGKSWSEIR